MNNVNLTKCCQFPDFADFLLIDNFQKYGYSYGKFKKLQPWWDSKLRSD